jgi:hypothetical protein
MTFVDTFIQTIIRHFKITLIIIAGFTFFFTYQYFQQTHNNHIEIFFDDDDPLFMAYEKFQDTYGNEEYGIITLESESLFSNAGFSVIAALTEALEKIDGIDRVLSLTNVEEFYGEDDTVELRKIIPDGNLSTKQIPLTKQRAFANKFVRDHLVSKSGTMTALHVGLEKLGEKAKRNAVLSMIETAGLIAGNQFTIHCSGSSLVEVEMNRLSERDFNLFVPALIVLIMVFIFILFRRITLAVLCQVNLVVILLWGVGFFVFCGEKFNIITNAMGAILLAIAIADSVHILSHLKETAQKTDLETIPAIKHTIRQVWFPCLFTSLTTGAGFLSFYISDIRPVAMLGLFTAISVIFAFLLSVTFMPALMILMQKFLTNSLQAFKIEKRSLTRPGISEQALSFCARIATRQKTALFIMFIAMMIFSVAGILQIKFATNTFQYLPDTNQIKSDLLVIEKNFGGTIPFIVVIQSETNTDFTDPDTVKQVEKFENKFVAENRQITSVFSIVEYVKEFNQAFNSNDPAFYRIPDSRLDIADAFELGDDEVLERIISPDHRQICITFNTIWDSNESGYRLHAQVTDYLTKTLKSDFSFHITGLSSLYLTMYKHLQESQIRSFFIAFTIIFLMMIIVCRNLWLALLCMIPNIFPIVMTLGLMGWFGIPLDVATTMIASVTIGIAVDDTTHFVSWLRRNSEIHNDAVAAIVQTFSDVGKPIVITTFLLFSGFMVLMLGSIIPTRMFGMLTAISMVFALIGDFFVLPPLILIFKPKLPPLDRRNNHHQ